MKEMHKHYHGDLKRLEAGLPYLLKHNQEHIKDLKKWIQRAREAHQEEVADVLEKVLELSLQITVYFETALSKLKYSEPH